MEGEGCSVTLLEITNYFDFWRKAKDACIGENHVRQLFAILKERYDDYKSIPLKEFSESLSCLFTGQKVAYSLNNTQEKNILGKLAITSVTFRNLQEVGGKTSKRFSVKEYNFYAMDEFSNKFSFCVNGKQFQKVWNSCKIVHTPESLTEKPLEPISTDTTKEKIKKHNSCKKSKRALFSESQTEELVSPGKRIKPNIQETDIDSHRIGLFTIKWPSLNEPPKKWLDRPIDKTHVDELVTILKDNPCAMVNGQTWIGIADAPKDRIKTSDDIKGCKIFIIGGVHRQKAYEKASEFSDEHRLVLQKVPVQVYDNQLSDCQIKRLAAQHNITNVGSRKTTWVERVQSCRQWRYEMEGKLNPAVDEVPRSTAEWRKDCQKMFVEGNKDVNTLEPTLQTALLPKRVFDLWEEAAKMFENGSLKDQNTKKSKKELTQNQLGMPFQGLGDDTKELVLRRLVNGEYSIKELQKTCSSIKKKKRIQQAFSHYVGETSWEAMARRFPNHTTESKLASFSDVTFTSRGPVPEVLIKHFQRAVMWEKDHQHPKVNLENERDNLNYYEGQEGATGLLLSSSMESLTESSLRSYIKNFKGFELTIIELSKEVDLDEIETCLMKVHAFNVEELPHYHIVFVLNGSCSLQEQDQIFELIQKKVHQAQMAYYVDSSNKVTKGVFMKSVVTPVVVGLWSSTGDYQQVADSGNAFVFPRFTSDRLPEEFYSAILKMFSYPGGWILTKTNGSALLGALANERNCLELASVDRFRAIAKDVSAHIKVVKHEKGNNGDDKDDVDDEVEITEGERQVEKLKEFRFCPVGEKWREDMCRKLEIPYLAGKHNTVGNYGTSFHAKMKPRKIVEIRGDGNCLFRAVSCAIAGSQNHHELLRKVTVGQMYTMGEKFRRYSGQDAEQYVTTTKMDEVGVWGTDIELHTLASLLEVNGRLVEEIFVASFQYWTRSPVLPVKAFVIVDVQNDFIRGSLSLSHCPAKEDGEEIVPLVNKLIENGSFNVLAYTFDWHPADHCSFFSNVGNKPVDRSTKIDQLKIFDKVTLTKPIVMEQILWPDHCLQNGWGAELHKDLRKPNLPEDIVVYKGKSSDVDSYSAFWDNGKLSQTNLFLKLMQKGVSDVYVGGLAFDFCVAYSAEDSALLGFNTFVIEDACRGVDLTSKAETKKKFGKLGIKLLQSSDVISK